MKTMPLPVPFFELSESIIVALAETPLDRSVAEPMIWRIITYKQLCDSQGILALEGQLGIEPLPWLQNHLHNFMAGVTLDEMRESLLGQLQAAAQSEPSELWARLIAAKALFLMSEGVSAALLEVCLKAMLPSEEVLKSYSKTTIYPQQISNDSSIVKRTD